MAGPVEGTVRLPPEFVVGGVSFVSSQGIWLMLQTRKQLANEGRVMHVCNFRPHVHRVFDTVGVFKAVPEWRED